MLSLAGLGDSYSYHDNNHIYNCKMVKGLGILDIIFCPHYEQDDLVIFNDIVNEYDKDVYALERAKDHGIEGVLAGLVGTAVGGAARIEPQGVLAEADQHLAGRFRDHHAVGGQLRQRRLHRRGHRPGARERRAQLQ